MQAPPAISNNPSSFIAGKPRAYRKGALKKFLPFCAKRDVILYQYKTNP
ncbi:hypothetical protein C4K37_5290 [Pseudomonas chlororaphis subsp. piscium]|nr:hypothetical protein C4K37_5290 [Pseudomonas chlororaphis subsp. piscium]AZC46206.1 hypothetical protein C4K36_5304 [Pseudomonas chlororaphis subsp. piscium]AZC84219.1 hypothetical protein C4K30_5128 [Pseudomonas chlororaphis subsp. piscium]